MERYTREQRLQIVQIFYQNNRSVAATLRALRPFYGPFNKPARSTIDRIVAKFESTFSLHNVPVPSRARSARSVENIAAARASVQEDANVSLTRRSQQLGLSVTSLWRILRKDLGLHPYKIKLTQQLKPFDHLKRRRFVNWAQEQIENDADFHRKIIFSDEAHFWLNGFVNKQNMRYWAGSNPHVIHEAPLHPEKVTVWCSADLCERVVENWVQRLDFVKRARGGHAKEIEFHT